jgi:hypothetical protein
MKTWRTPWTPWTPWTPDAVDAEWTPMEEEANQDMDADENLGNLLRNHWRTPNFKFGTTSRRFNSDKASGQSRSGRRAI